MLALQIVAAVLLLTASAAVLRLLWLADRRPHENAVVSRGKAKPVAGDRAA